MGKERCVTSSRSNDEKSPEWFVNTATAPRRLGGFAAVVVTALGLVMVWLAATHPLWGLGLAHPVTITAAGLVICAGLALIAIVWRKSDADWRRVQDGPLSAEFRALADAGRVEQARDRLREETRASVCEAQQVVELYLARRVETSREP